MDILFGYIKRVRHRHGMTHHKRCFSNKWQEEEKSRRTSVKREGENTDRNELSYVEQTENS